MCTAQSHERVEDGEVEQRRSRSLAVFVCVLFSLCLVECSMPKKVASSMMLHR